MDGKLIGLVRDTVVDRYGEQLWTSLAEPCGPEADGSPSDALACWIGRDSVPALRDTYPSLFDRHDSLAGFIQGLGDDLPAIAVSQDTESPAIGFAHSNTPDGSLLLRIEADCSLCALVQGVIAGAAVHYDEEILISELKSPRRGDNACVLQIEVGDQSDQPETEWPDLKLAVI